MSLFDTGISTEFENNSIKMQRGSKQLNAYIDQSTVKHKGIYALYDEGGVPLYVGMSSDLNARIRSHFKYRQYPSTYFVEYITFVKVLEISGESVSRAELRKAEDSLIKVIKPLFNGTSSTNLGIEGVYGYKNLREQLDEIKQKAIEKYRGDTKGELRYARKEVTALMKKETEKEAEESNDRPSEIMYSVRESIKLAVRTSEEVDVDKIIDGLLIAVKLTD